MSKEDLWAKVRRLREERSALEKENAALRREGLNLRRENTSLRRRLERLSPEAAAAIPAVPSPELDQLVESPNPLGPVVILLFVLALSRAFSTWPQGVTVPGASSLAENAAGVPVTLSVMLLAGAGYIFCSTFELLPPSLSLTPSRAVPWAVVFLATAAVWGYRP